MNVCEQGLLENPIGDVRPEEKRLAPRIEGLQGKTGLFLSNGQQNSDGMLVSIERLLSQRHGLTSAIRMQHSAGQQLGGLPTVDFVIGGIGL
ncbi:MAG: hypothetical protein ABIH46_13370 [Chloroflexota bacterium]